MKPILTSHFTSLDTTIVYHSIPLGSGESRFGPLTLFSKQCVGITGECWRACVCERFKKAWDSAYMWMLKNEAATFRPPVHMLGHQSPHQSDHAHPLGRPGRNGGLPCRLLWRRMLKTTVWMNADDCSIMSWIWTWTLKISQPTAVEKHSDLLALNAFWSRRNMTKHLSNSKCFQIVPPFVPKCFGDMYRLCFVLPCPNLCVYCFLAVLHQSSCCFAVCVGLPRCQIWDSHPRLLRLQKCGAWKHGIDRFQWMSCMAHSDTKLG